MSDDLPGLDRWIEDGPSRGGSRSGVIYTCPECGSDFQVFSDPGCSKPICDFCWIARRNAEREEERRRAAFARHPMKESA